MYNNIYSKVPQNAQHQTDTDSLFLNSTDLIKLKNENKDLFGEEFGQLDIEEYEFSTFYAIRPKVYAGIGIEGSAGKMRMKGVSGNATIIKDDDNDFIESIKNDFTIKWNLYEDKDTDKLKNNIEYAFERLVNKKPIHIIQTTFVKTGIDGNQFYKNGKINCGITMSYPLKKIQ